MVATRETYPATDTVTRMRHYQRTKSILTSCLRISSQWASWLYLRTRIWASGLLRSRRHLEPQGVTP